MEVKITKWLSGNWIEGTAEGGYVFQALIFDEPSQYGINEGRVSKLTIRRGDKTWASMIMNYDRGWDIEPACQSDKEVYEAVLSYLENRPKGQR